ncbi:MAG: Flp family type IVb pilin [Thermodesulfovibrionales bacterium]
MKEFAANTVARVRKAMGQEEGAAAVEYALITGLVAVVIVPAVSELGLRIRDIFETLSNAMVQ